MMRSSLSGTSNAASIRTRCPSAWDRALDPSSPSRSRVRPSAVIEPRRGRTTPRARARIGMPRAPRPTSPGGRLVPNWFVSQRLAQIGPCVAAVLPDDKGLALIDLVPGAPLRILNPPDRAVLSVVGDPGGTRLVTIEQVLEDPMAALDGLSAAEPVPAHNDFQVNLWDPDHLDRPIKKLQWTRPGPPGRQTWLVPLVTISPDGRTVAVAAFRGKFVRLFSAVDGEPLARNEGRTEGRVPGRNEGRGEERLEIDTQTELSALALGPNDSLATAGTTAGGVMIKIWNLVDPRAVPTSLTPLNQNFTRLMRFSPQGTLLAIAGVGPIELWDPAGAQPGGRAEDERSGHRPGFRARRPNPRRRWAARRVPSSGRCTTRQRGRS